jgi:phosphoglucomutase
LLLHYILSYRAEQGAIPANAVMCNTVVTSTLGDRVCEHFGVSVEKTLTGFKFIGDKLHTYEVTGDRTYVFGYEESYGCLIGDFARDKDAVQASLMLCEAAAYYKAQGKTLWDVLAECYELYGYCLDKVVSVEHKGEAGVKKIASLLQTLRTEPPRMIGDVQVSEVEDYLSERMQSLGFPPSNVLRFLLSDGGFVAVRPSGTEPKCKYYYCMIADSASAAEQKLAAARAVFEE